MMRSVLALLTLVGVMVILSNSPLAAGGKGGKTAGKKGHDEQDAIIITVDTKTLVITVEIQEEKGGKKGKEKGNHKQYHLTESTKIVDAQGKASNINALKKDDHVKIVEHEGKLQELHLGGAGTKTKAKAK